jgi:hypothetical protein
VQAVKPYLLLDVDGALSPLFRQPLELGRRNYDDCAGIELISIHAMWGGVLVDARLPRWLGELAQVYELVWATTWEDTASALEGGLGLTRLPHIAFKNSGVRRLSGPGSRSAKVAEVAAYVGARPFAWVDDRLGVGARAWAAGRPYPSLLISTNKYRGIEERHVVRLLAWAAALASSAAEYCG